MARGKRKTGSKDAGAAPDDAALQTGAKPALPLPSPEASTNLVIADIVLRAAGGMLRERLEKGLIVGQHGDTTEAHRLVDKRGVAASAMLWGASRLARRSPLGLAVVAGGLAAKVFYDRGKRLGSKGKASQPGEDES